MYPRDDTRQDEDPVHPRVVSSSTSQTRGELRTPQICFWQKIPMLKHVWLPLVERRSLPAALGGGAARYAYWAAWKKCNVLDQQQAH
jgi:hypothetical protein